MIAFEEFIQKYPLASFKKGETLLLKDEAPKGVYVIEKGKVSAYYITSGGNERQVMIHERLDDIPVGYSVDLVTKSEYFYRAYTACKVRVVPVKAFNDYMRSNPDALLQRNIQLSMLLLTTLNRISALEHSRAGDKIAFVLDNMADQVGVKLRPYKNRLKLSITQQEIADIAGLTRETAGHELKKLELKNIISHSRNSYVLYMEKLKQYLETR